MSLVAARSGLLEPLREFVKLTLSPPPLLCLLPHIVLVPSTTLEVPPTFPLRCTRRVTFADTLAGVRVDRNPTFGTCAGLILLSECANRTKKGGQDLIGGLDVRVNRNHFGRQTESFEADICLSFLAASSLNGSLLSSSVLDDGGTSDGAEATEEPFRAIFIRAPVVEKVLPAVEGEQVAEKGRADTVVAPARGVPGGWVGGEVEVLARLGGKERVRRKGKGGNGEGEGDEGEGEGDIVAVRQGNVFGTSFHPELTRDPRIHVWWLRQVAEMVGEKRRNKGKVESVGMVVP